MTVPSVEAFNESREKAETRDVIEGRRELKSKVNYRFADEQDERRCSECEYFVSPGQRTSDCEKIIGQVNADAICDLFEKNEHPPLKEDPDRDGDVDEPETSKAKVIQILIQES